MWEHAYYLQYKNVKADWVEAFWEIVNWPDVADRFAKARTLDLARLPVRDHEVRFSSSSLTTEKRISTPQRTRRGSSLADTVMPIRSDPTSTVKSSHNVAGVPRSNPRSALTS